MGELDRYYSGENASWRVWQAQEAEGRERGISQALVEQEQLKAEWERRQEDAARVRALVNRYGSYDRIVAALAAEAEAERVAAHQQAAADGPPSSGRQISPPRPRY